ncbi:hypothetical protein CYMTET_55519 [Cymbomonas tetramitiformis]|uniref:Uncharacterized protein n=1 Tax=Cymbomonas tetramitiformis TaxID=36881 RepID=A0AAE0BCU7_9CHLO|nr:hypothetical protein CYMTET_55519 [Cymbomonas tetramitiformis]
MIQLRATLDGNASAQGGPEARRAKLAFIEEKVYHNADGFVAEPIFTQWLQEFEASRRRAVMNNTTKKAAQQSTRSKIGSGTTTVELADLAQPPPHRISLDADAARALGLAEGPALMRDVCTTNLLGSSPSWDRAEAADSLGEGTAEEGSLARGGRRCGGAAVGVSWSENHLAARTYAAVRSRSFTTGSDAIAAHLDNGAWGRTKKTQKLMRLGKTNDWCFSFDLQDGYDCVGIDPDFQKFMQFDVPGDLFQCGAQ